MPAAKRTHLRQRETSRESKLIFSSNISVPAAWMFQARADQAGPTTSKEQGPTQREVLRRSSGLVAVPPVPARCISTPGSPSKSHQIRQTLANSFPAEVSRVGLNQQFKLSTLMVFPADRSGTRGPAACPAGTGWGTAEAARGRSSGAQHLAGASSSTEEGSHSKEVLTATVDDPRQRCLLRAPRREGAAPGLSSVLVALSSPGGEETPQKKLGDDGLAVSEDQGFTTIPLPRKHKPA